MITYDELTPAQSRWMALVEYYFPDKVICGTITTSELKTIHEFFVAKRNEGKKYKVSWPIWLIMNNALERGLYQLPPRVTNVQVDPDITHEYYDEYVQELKEFSVIA